MIVIEINSGLGNQLFMYAAAKALALKHKAELYLDVDIACREGYGIGQSYQLNKFKISAQYADRKILNQFSSTSRYSAVYEKIRRDLRNLKLVRNIASYLRGYGMNVSNIVPTGCMNASKIFQEDEDDWKYKSEFLLLPDDVYLKGYFPSFKYFDHIKSLLTDEFTLNVDLSIIGKSVLDKIRGSNSISMHFRRGDVVTVPRYKQWYEGIVTENYYRNSIDYLSKELTRPHFFIFSNDIDWVKENFEFHGSVTYVDHNGPQTGYEDLYLMSQCKHNVTTGCSSFSWWAAYLNNNPEKIVIRTEKLNGVESMNHPADFFPPDWIVIGS